MSERENVWDEFLGTPAREQGRFSFYLVPAERELGEGSQYTQVTVCNYERWEGDFAPIVPEGPSVSLIQLAVVHTPFDDYWNDMRELLEAGGKSYEAVKANMAVEGFVRETAMVADAYAPFENIVVGPDENTLSFIDEKGEPVIILDRSTGAFEVVKEQP